jgi:hypothetical protein
MNMNKFLVVSGAVVVGVVNLALAGDSPGKPAAKGKLPSDAAAVNAAGSKSLVLGYLQGRHRTITIKAGEKGPVYSVAGADGKVLFEDLSLEQLRAKAPEVHEFIKSAVAANTRPTGSTVDASLRIHSR